MSGIAGEAAVGLEFQLFQGCAGLQTLRPQWLELLAGLPRSLFLHRPEWYQCYLETIASAPDKVLFVAAYRAGQLQAVLPLESRRRRLAGIWFEELGTIESVHLNLSDFAISPAAANAQMLREFTRWLRRQKLIAWDLLRLGKIADGSCIDRSLRQCPPGKLMSIAFAHSFYLDTSGSYEAATGSVSGSFKRNLRRLARRAGDGAPLSWECVSSAAELDQAFETFLDLEASGWKGTQGEGSAIRCNPALRQYYQQLLEAHRAQERCRIMLLRHGGQAIAAQFAVQDAATLSLLKIGYSHAHSHLAPGNLVMERTLQHACASPNIDVVSLVTGPPWATLWKPHALQVWSHVLVNGTPRGLLWALMLRAKRAVAAIQKRAAKATPGARDAHAGTGSDEASAAIM